MTDNTVLTLATIGVPDFSARGLKQTISPIPASSVPRRTINGDLRDFSYAQFRKYASVITGDDQDPPALDFVFPGAVLQVGFIAELAFLTSTAGPERPAVTNSERVDGAFTFYRPKLSMMVVSFNIQKDEWGAQVSWELHLEEI